MLLLLLLLLLPLPLPLPLLLLLLRISQLQKGSAACLSHHPLSCSGEEFAAVDSCTPSQSATAAPSGPSSTPSDASAAPATQQPPPQQPPSSAGSQATCLRKSQASTQDAGSAVGTPRQQSGGGRRVSDAATEDLSLFQLGAAALRADVSDGGDAGQSSADGDKQPRVRASTPARSGTSNAAVTNADAEVAAGPAGRTSPNRRQSQHPSGGGGGGATPENPKARRSGGAVRLNGSPEQKWSPRTAGK